jgi:hypothetical protein
MTIGSGALRATTKLVRREHGREQHTTGRKHHGGPEQHAKECGHVSLVKYVCSARASFFLSKNLDFSARCSACRVSRIPSGVIGVSQSLRCVLRATQVAW